jgi:hypothetical protein
LCLFEVYILSAVVLCGFCGCWMATHAGGWKDVTRRAFVRIAHYIKKMQFEILPFYKFDIKKSIQLRIHMITYPGYVANN